MLGVERVSSCNGVPASDTARAKRKGILSQPAVFPSHVLIRDSNLARAHARKGQGTGILDNGVYASVSEIGDAENISKSYVSRILGLALLAPDVVEEILAGTTNQGMVLEHLERPLPASWEEQRGCLLSARTS
jgi:hypothetical protein